VPQTPLHIAASKDQQAAVKRLVEKGANINAKAKVHARRALAASPQSLFRRTHTHRSNCRPWPLPTPAPPQDGQAAFHFAARNGHVDLIEPLLAKGADIEAKDNQAPPATAPHPSPPDFLRISHPRSPCGTAHTLAAHTLDPAATPSRHHPFLSPVTTAAQHPPGPHARTRTALPRSDPSDFRPLSARSRRSKLRCT
jgi:hypothetical protein